MKYTIVLFILFFNLTAYCQNFKPVSNEMLFCAEADEEYLFLKASHQKDTFQWVWPTDICESVTNKTEIKFKPEKSFSLWLNNQKKPLTLKQSYHSLLPEGIYFGYHLGKQLCIIEFSLVSYSGMNGYNYLIIDYSDAKNCKLKEVNSSVKKTITSLIK